MAIDFLKGWTGSVELNGKVYASVQAFNSASVALKAGDSIILRKAGYKPATETEKKPVTAVEKPAETRITVKAYMTKPACPGFDFMAKWNNNEPMPLRTMTGVKVKETPGMVYMKLHGDIWARRICTCMCCGRELTNPVSQFFGIGPECGGHNYTHPFDSDEELREAVKAYRAHLQSITWEGWIVKSAITNEEVVNNVEEG